MGLKGYTSLMESRDPIQQIEALVRGIHDALGARTQPVLRRYPLTFAFLFVFAVAAILHGFELVIDRIAFFGGHPWVLLIGGIILLFITGSLYRWLEHKL